MCDEKSALLRMWSSNAEIYCKTHFYFPKQEVGLCVICALPWRDKRDGAMRLSWCAFLIAL